MTGALRIGDAPVVTLTAQDAPAEGPAFVEAQILPGRGMMLLQARLRLASGRIVEALHAPAPEAAARILDGGPGDFAGNASFSFGGAILLPYANRIRGRALRRSREIEASIDGRHVRLPRNWGGRARGAEQYAMHGLILASRFAVELEAADLVRGRLEAGGFGGRWPGTAGIEVTWSLAGGRLALKVSTASGGPDRLPLGVGWHPYFALPSGDRGQARLRVPAARRAEVNDYDEVLPTGRLLEVAGTDYDFTALGGRALEARHLDDCFTDLGTSGGFVDAELFDPAANLALRISAAAPPVKAVQVYAPPDQAFVVVEPQFNLADPFGAEWPEGLDTGMARLEAGESLAYDAVVTALAV